MTDPHTPQVREHINSDLRDLIAADIIEAWTSDRHTKGQALRDLARLAVAGLHSRGLLRPGLTVDEYATDFQRRRTEVPS